ncbi:hypothetical protein MKW94_022605 [Papaver nudicaule]|uniref:Bms1-type G domain-containing protein n=1 Tax=Papaver nudicaule TaxID=74823 RepID=A0AA42ATF0_PAPNU|nr:hypothetical protein [Papaver nudicaule]
MASSGSNQQDHRLVTYCRSNNLYTLKVYEPHGKREVKKRKRDDDGESQQDSLHTPEINLPTSQEEEPPYVIVVQGPPNVGKSLLIKSLVKYYTNQQLDDIQGPVVTVVLGELRRIQFVECPNNINGMIDAAKYADLVLLLVDAAFGYEMETFEFLNLLKIHGFPNVAGVLTHLDEFVDTEKLNETKQRLGRQFWKEINDGAELFYLSQLSNGMYQNCQIQKLAEFISAMKFYAVPCRDAQPYMLVDRFEDVTPPERAHIDKKCDRNINLYGYLRGCNMKRGTKMHIAGVGDFPINGITSVIDPYPLLSADNRDNLDEVTRLDMESFRTGTYIRLEIQDVSFGIAENFDPCHPILVGGISLEEDKVGYLQVRLKRHIWQEKLLKTGEPVVVSVGWRRYETRPIYAIEGSRLNEKLPYTPWDAYCLAMFWGPLAAPTGPVAVHNAADNEGVFRISATGVVLDSNQAAKIREISKRIGIPCEIYKKTALIKDMFKSDSEIKKFEGALVKTARGVGGEVKTARGVFGKIIKAREGDQLTQGIVRCSFRSEISMSDEVFMPVWKQVEVPRAFNLFSAPWKSNERRRAVVFVEEPPSFLAGSKQLELSDDYQAKKHVWSKKIPKVKVAQRNYGDERLLRRG